MNNKPETYFLKFALPAAKFCGLSEKDTGILESILIHSRFPSSKHLEKLFPVAIERIKKFSNTEDIWNSEVIKDYWLNKEGHNKIVETPFCRVYFGEIIAENPQYTVNINGRVIISNTYEPLFTGDKVACHFNKITTKLSEGDINKYFRK